MALHQQEPELMRAADPAAVLDGLDAGVDPNMPSGDLQTLLGSMLRSTGDEQLSLTQLLMDQKMSFGVNSQSLSLSGLDESMGMALSHSGALGLPSIPPQNIAAGLNTIDLRDIAVPSEDSMRDLEEVLSQNNMMVDMKYPHCGISDTHMIDEEKSAARDILQHELELQQRKHEHDLLMRQQIDQQLQQQLHQQQLHQQVQQLAQQQSIAQVTSTAHSEPTLTVINQPYPCQKKRYKTDGLKRGIIKGSNNGEYPTVQIEKYNGSADIIAYAATSTSDPHPFYDMEVSPDSYNTQPTALSDGTPCVQITTGPSQNMRAIFSGVSTKRIKMKDVKQRAHYDRWLPESEIVHLGFLAFIPNCTHPQHILSCLSQSIDVYDALPEMPVLRKAICTQGSYTGGYDMCLVGLHFTGARVRFCQYNNTGLTWEQLAEYDPQDCTETHLVVRVPPYPALPGTVFPVKVHIEVLTGPVKMPRRSAAVVFLYTNT